MAETISTNHTDMGDYLQAGSHDPRISRTLYEAAPVLTPISLSISTIYPCFWYALMSLQTLLEGVVDRLDCHLDTLDLNLRLVPNEQC